MCETPVLMIFFNRPDKLERVFAEVKKNKPKTVYLFQDGPRNDNDMQKILECRRVVQEIDWECTVQRNYCTENNGCGMGPYKAISWIFQNEERAIILEDDCVPSASFFSFCDEMTAKYKDDNRIFMITGCNLELETKTNSSYFFGYSGTNWGWATWKRSWQQMDYSCSWVKNHEIKRDLKALLTKCYPRKAKKEISLFQNTNTIIENGGDVSYWDVQFQATRYLNNQLSIIPSKNLITNIGFGTDSTHSKKELNDLSYNRNVGKINAFNNHRYELDFPLKHPPAVMPNSEYDLKVDKYIYGVSLLNLFKKIKRKIYKRIGK